MTTVIVLAAGSGTRMLDIDLVPKPLLPYKGKAILSHVIEAFPEGSKFIFALPTNRCVEADYVRAMHPNLDAMFNYMSTSSPLMSLRRALGSIDPDLKGGVYVTVADGVYPKVLPSTESWLGMYEVTSELTQDYMYLELDLDPDAKGKQIFIDKVKSVWPRLAWTGLAYFNDFTALKATVSRLEITEMSQLFTRLAKRKAFGLRQLPWWVDLGTKDKYLNAIRDTGFDWAKPDQITYATPKRIVKFYQFKPGVAHSATSQFRTRGIALATKKVVVPKVTQHGYFVAYDTLGTLGTPPINSRQLSRLLNAWFAEDKDFSHVDTRDYSLKLLTNRIEYRLREYSNNCSSPLSPLNSRVVKLIALVKKIETFHTFVLTGEVHGDLTINNVISLPRDKVAVIDWRTSVTSDLMYDLAKLYLSLKYDLDKIKRGEFVFEYRKSVNTVVLPASDHLGILLKEFESWLTSRKIEVKQVSAYSELLLLAMCGCHKEPFASALFSHGEQVIPTLFNKTGQLK